jgi:hypothetical protein
MKAILFFSRKPALAVNIQNIRIASPCPADWNKMIGDDRMRHCAECNLNVYNFSAMTEREVQRLIAGSQGRVCGRFYRRSDGTMLTQDCPRGLRAVARRVSRTAAALLTAVMSVSSAFAGTKSKPQQTEQNQCREPGVALVVMDPQGAVIQNAEVTLADKDGKMQRNGKTSSIGLLIFRGLHNGEYVVTVNSRGFRTFSQTVTVQHGKLLELKLKLGIAQATTVVEVQATGGLIETDATSQSSTIPFVPSSGRPQPMR